MPRRNRIMKRIRNAWRRLFQSKPKTSIFEGLEGFDGDNKMKSSDMSEDDLEGLVSGVTNYIENMREEHLKNIEIIRRGHDSTDDMDMNQNYFMKTEEVEQLQDMEDKEEEEITYIRSEKYGCEIMVQIRPIGH